MPLEEGEGISESQVSFYDIAGHSHDGTNSTQIDFSAYNILDIIDIGQLRSIIMGTVNNSTISPNMLQVGFAEGTVRIDGAAPSTVTNLTASSTASTTSDGNSFIDTSWVGSTNDSINRYVVELHKSETGISGTYVITRSHETTALSHRFERIDTNAGDVGNIYYKVIVYAISPVGVYSVPATSSGIAPAVNTTPPANTTFNDDYAAFDEGVKPAFKGMFVYLDDNTEFDVKELRGKYEYQVSVNKTSFDTSANLKASGKSKSTYFLVNNLEVRASAGGSKIDYYLRVRAINSSGTASTWVYYKNTADGGSSGVGTTTASAASAINVLEIDAGVDVQANTITANEIFAGTITATEIESATITGDELNSITINASRYIQSPDFVSGSAGWKIEGDGNAEFSEVTVRGVIYANTGRIGGTNGWTIASDIIQSIPSAANAVHLNSGGGGSSSIPYLRMGAKTAHDNANAGVWLDPTNGLVLGPSTTGAWIKPDGKFYLGGTSGSLVWDGSTLTVNGGGVFTGTLSGVDGTFEGTLAAGTVLSGSIEIGSGNDIFKVDTDGDMWVGHATQTSAPFRVNKDGAVIASDLTIEGGAITGLDSTGININSGVFTVSDAGAVTASNLTISGGQLTVGSSANNVFRVDTNGDMWIGHAAKNSAPFRVSNTGYAVAQNLSVTGGTMYLGAVRISSSGFSSGLTGGGVDSPFYVSDTGLMSFGVNGGAQLRIQPSNQSFIWDGTALEFASSPSATSTHGFIQGDSATITLFGTSATFEGVTMGACEENYVGVFKVWGTSDNYGIVLSATQDGEDVILLNADQGIRITDNVPTTKTGKLYAQSGGLYWNNIRLDTSGSSGVDSIIAGTAIDVSGATGDVTITHEDYATAGTYGGVGNYVRSLTVNDQGHVTGIDTEPESTIAETFYWVVAANGTSGTTQIGPSTETLTFRGFGASTVTRGSNTIDITSTDTVYTHPTSAGNKHIPSGGSANQFLKYSSSGTAVWADAPADATKLPLSAGASYPLTGHLYLTGARIIQASGNLYCRSTSGSNYGMTAWAAQTDIHRGTAAYIKTANGYIQVTETIQPSADNSLNLGGGISAHRFKNGYFSNNVYTHDGGVHVSDVAQKTDVVDATLGLDFVKGLRPVSYKWVETDGRAGIRTHQGFIAQEVETLLGGNAASTALWCNAHQEAVAEEEMDDGVIMAAVEESYTQSLRYTELVPVLTKAIQELEARVAALEA